MPPAPSHSAALLVLLATLNGCSFLMVQSPPARVAPFGPVRCTTSLAAPVVDSVVAGASGTLGAFSLAAAVDDTPTPSTPGSPVLDFSGLARTISAVGAAISFLAALVYVLSAADGYEDTLRCRALRSRAGAASR